VEALERCNRKEWKERLGSEVATELTGNHYRGNGDVLGTCAHRQAAGVLAGCVEEGQRLPENKDYERKKGEMDPCATNMVLHVAPSSGSIVG